MYMNVTEDNLVFSPKIKVKSLVMGSIEEVVCILVSMKGELDDWELTVKL